MLVGFCPNLAKKPNFRQTQIHLQRTEKNSCVLIKTWIKKLHEDLFHEAIS